MIPRLDIPIGLSPAEAEGLQARLASRVVLEDRFERIELVAGLDVAYEKNGDRCVAAVALLRASDLRVVEIRTRESVVPFPYLPGLFAFRELPALSGLLREISRVPDLLLCDGQGTAHPRRFGLACHLGLMFDLPAIGCAKTLLAGSAAEPGTERGASMPLVYEAETVGCCLRTRTGVKPVYVSPGHRISVASACDWVLRLAPRFRLPEPLRLAHQAARSARLEWAL